MQLVTMKLVGYTEAIHALLPELREHASILLFGGLAKDRPYPGSTTVSTVNGGITGMVRTLAMELAPIRVNALASRHRRRQPGMGGQAAGGARGRARPHAARAADHDGRDRGACEFLLENGAVNGVNLAVDGGWLLM